jgi:hypothetical protein
VTTPAPTGLLNAPISTITPPTTTPPTAAPGGGAPPVATYNPSTATATKADATGYTPNTFNVAPNQTVSDQIQHIIAAGSSLMQQAESNARNLMNQRGLINSTMGISADQSALYTAATPIATADANTFNTAATNTVTAQNKALADEAAAKNTASLANSQTGTQNSQFNAGATNTAGQAAAGASNTLQQTLAQIAGSKDVATLQTNSAQAIARIQSDTTLSAQDKQDQTNQILAQIQSSTTLTNTDKANASAQIIAGIQASTTLSATDKQAASAQVIAQLNANTNLTIQDKATQSAQLIAKLNADTNLSVQDKQDLTTLAVQSSQTALQTFLGNLQADTQKTIQQKSAEATAALASVNNLSAQQIAHIQGDTSLSVTQQQTETQKIIAQANNQNAIAVQNLQNAAALENIKQNGVINTAITNLTNDNKTLLQTSQGAAQLYNQALANIQAIMTSPNLNTQQQADAMNNTVATLNAGLAAFSSIAGNPAIASTLNFGPPSAGTPTSDPATIAANTQAINQFYQQTLGRTPSAGDLQGDLAAIASGQTLDQIRQSITSSPEAQQHAAATTTANTNTITQLYRQLLGRDPDAAGLQGDLAAMQQGQTADQIKATIAASPEAQQRTASNTNAITQAFQQNMGRAPTAADLQYYLGQITAGSTPEAQANAIAQSPDAQAYRTANTNTITQAFQTSMGRAPSQADLQYYLGQIANGQTPAALASSIAQSPEAQAYAAQQQNKNTPPPAGGGLINQPVTTQPTGAVDPATQASLLQGYIQKYGFSPSQALYQGMISRVGGGTSVADAINAVGNGQTAPPPTTPAPSPTTTPPPTGPNTSGGAPTGATATALSTAYQSALGRPPSSAELAYFNTLIQSGQPLSFVTSNIRAITTGYHNTYG